MNINYRKKVTVQGCHGFGTQGTEAPATEVATASEIRIEER